MKIKPCHVFDVHDDDMMKFLRWIKRQEEIERRKKKYGMGKKRK